jgi:transcriptional regulator with XRE-family HTH domain
MTPTINPLRFKRILKGKTQWDVANDTGINQSKISLIETGRITNIPEEERAKLAQAVHSNRPRTFSELEPE